MQNRTHHQSQSAFIKTDYTAYSTFLFGNMPLVAENGFDSKPRVFFYICHPYNIVINFKYNSYIKITRMFFINNMIIVNILGNIM